MSSEMLKHLCEELGDDVIRADTFRGDDIAIVKRGAWKRSARFLKEKYGFDMLTDLCGVDYPDRDDRFEVVAHLYSTGTGARVRLKTGCPEDDPSLPSLSDVWRGANWFEREAYDLFGVEFEGHPDLKRILCHQGFEGHPLRKDYPKAKRGDVPEPEDLLDEMSVGNKDGQSHVTRNTLHDNSQNLQPVTCDVRRIDDDASLTDSPEEKIYLNMGPSHPAMHGCFRTMVELSGERINDAAVEIGYLHRGFEKEAEDHTWTGVIPYTDRLNYVSPMLNNTGYCMAVEKLMGIDVPERARWIRTLACEVSRICDHLVCIGANLVDMGALTNYWYLFGARELFLDWIEELSGARLTSNYSRVGGVARDVPSDSEARLRKSLKGLRRAVKDVRGLIRHNRIFLDRTRGIGAISKEDAIDYGFTGPCLRATGCDYDVRRAHPYLVYDELDWDIPIGTDGDTYDRIFVRMEEIEQSARMVEQIVGRMPGGPVVAFDGDVSLPPKHEVYGSIEGMIKHFKLAIEGISVPEGEIYSFTEAANGELGFYIVSNGTEKPYRIKVRPPCFPVFQAFPKLIEGHMIADVVAIFGSLNIIAGELDR